MTKILPTWIILLIVGLTGWGLVSTVTEKIDCDDRKGQFVRVFETGNGWTCIDR